jgi:acetylornithine deacetylase/succinyl-diaminopimelate desuccinylase-like protein
MAEAARDPYLRDNPPRLERALMRPFTGVSTDLDHPVIAALSSSHEAVRGQPAPLVGMFGASDAMIFGLYSNTPAVLFGPGNARTAHSPEEFVATADVITATDHGPYHPGLLWLPPPGSRGTHRRFPSIGRQRRPLRPRQFRSRS